MKKIIILDFQDGQVMITSINTEVWDDVEDFIISIGWDPSNCQWMLVDKLNLKIEE